MTTKKNQSATHDAGDALAKRQQEMATCMGCNTHYPGYWTGQGPTKRGIGDGTPGGLWLFDCCYPGWYDEEMMGEL